MEWKKSQRNHAKSIYASGFYSIRSDGFTGWNLYYLDELIRHYSSVAAAKSAAERHAQQNEEKNTPDYNRDDK